MVAKRSGWSAVRSAVMAAMRWVRRLPWVHAPVHAVAVLLTRHPRGMAFVQSLLEPQYIHDVDYRRWVSQHDTLSAEDRQAILNHIARFDRHPIISVIMPAYNTPQHFLRAAIESVRMQLYPHWELCIADDASTDPMVWRILEDAARADSRIKVIRRSVNGHISAASNTALGLATGDFVALMDHDDLIPAHALYEVAAAIVVRPDLDLIFSDEDKIDEEGRRFEPHFKTDWNPELLLSQNMVSHLGVYRHSLVRQIGGFRIGFEGSQDYDLVLRFAEATRPERIHHIPAILYHWRQQAGPGSFSETDQERCGAAAQRAVQEHLRRLGADVDVERQPDAPTWLRIRRKLPTPLPLVSIIVPTRDRVDLLERCVDGVLNATDYPAFELLIADNDSVEPATKALFERLADDARVRIIPTPGAFNYSKINNIAAAEARGEILILLNNDICVISPEWLGEMVAQAVRPEVGAVGARLLYGDGRVQHAGVILGVGGTPPVAGNLYVGAAADDPGYYNHLQLPRNMSAVTAACLAVRKAVFDEVGGLDAVNLAVAFNDVDLCLRIGRRGYQIVWTPYAELFHLESASRGSDTRAEHRPRFRQEIDFMRAQWSDLLDNDPFYGPNFDSRCADYRLASPPRRSPPWRRAALQAQEVEQATERRDDSGRPSSATQG